MSNKLLASAGLAVLLSTGFVANAFAADDAQQAQAVATRVGGTNVKTGAEQHARYHHTQWHGDSTAVKKMMNEPTP
ncbi:MAG TPA: hypothetical protein VGO34_04075 [Alphaproteobacteria bacterium]|jgi:hypothetical protein